MGWEVQGYYKNPGEAVASWQVDCSGDSLEEVEAFAGRNPLTKAEADRLEIYFGNRELEMFRGISSLTDPNKVKELLAKFEGFLVYAEKWNPVKKPFKTQILEFLDLGSLFIFYEKIEDNPSLLKRGLIDLLERLSSRKATEEAGLKTLLAYIQNITDNESG